MADFIAQLLRRAKVGKADSASQSKIDALAERLGVTFPKSLLQLWRASDSIPLDALDAHLLGPAEILLLLEENTWPPQLVERGCVPLLDDHQSNYLAVMVRPPLAFRIAHLLHDDSSRLLYRNVDGFARGLLEALDSGDSADSFFRETQGDYPPDAPRPPRDQEAARALLATDGADGEWNYAVQLLDASNLDEWAKLLETDHFIRRDVVDRLRSMQEPAIHELLERDQRTFQAFARTVAKAARSAGLEVGERKHDCLQIGGKWMNLEMSFYRRNIPNAMPRLLAWFEDVIAGRNPYDRDGHFMTD